ncbi:MAG TPA: 5-formyltetrahydrofolate cyclo-ligase [Actinomycetota bacterium]
MTDDPVKATLRAEMRRVRAAIPEGERRRRGEAIRKRVLGLPEVRRAGSVLVFASFGSEVPTRDLASDLHAAGKRLLLPYLSGEVMEVAEVGPDERLAPSSYGPGEPERRVRADPAGIDVVIAPGLAFDRRGNRLGYGGGAYDRFLARVRPEALVVGVAFAEQVVEEVPAGPSDVPVHLMVTDREVIDARRE